MRFNRLDDEDKLLHDISAGNQAAFGTLFNGYFNQVAAFVNTLTGSETLTEEIIIDVFTKIWINRKKLEDIERFNAYLFILVRNFTLNCIRKENSLRKKQESYYKTVKALMESDFLENEDESNHYALIDRAVLMLSPQQHKVFTLRNEGLKNPEIAEIMNISTETVAKYQQLAMKFIAEFMKANAFVSAILWSLTHITK